MGRSANQQLAAFIARHHEPIAVVCDLGLTGLAVTLSLGRAGIPVLGLTEAFNVDGAYSRYCFKALSPDPRRQPDDYLCYLTEIGKLLKTKAVLIPTSDSSVELPCRAKTRLAPYYLFPMSDFDVVKSLSDKGEFKQVLAKLGLPHPRTFVPDPGMGIERIAAEVRYPCILKPIHVENFTAQFHAKVLVAEDRATLMEAYAKAVAGGHDIIVQEWVPGPVTDLYSVQGYFNAASEPLGVFSLKKIRQYPRQFGVGSFCVSVPLPTIVEGVTQFMKQIRYQGFIDAELKLDSRDNQHKYIEINPRPCWQTRLATRCGINLPLLAYLDALGRPIPRLGDQVNGIHWLSMHGDMKSALEAWQSGELTARHYLRSLIGKTEFAVYAWDDPIPFFFSIKQSAKAGVRKAARKLFRRS